MMMPTPEILIQAVFILVTLAISLALYTLPRKHLTKLRSKSRTSIQSNRHFLQAAQLLTRARSSSSSRNHHQSTAHARSALAHADAAIALNPRDPASHILRAVTLDLLGRKSAAVKSLDAALAMKHAMSGSERADALVKRAEIQIGVNRRRRVDCAIKDLVEAVAGNGGGTGSVKAWCLLGECYEYKGMRDQAVAAYRKAVELESAHVVANEGLRRLERSICEEGVREED